jgi:hypothetical protein
MLKNEAVQGAIASGTAPVTEAADIDTARRQRRRLCTKVHAQGAIVRAGDLAKSCDPGGNRKVRRGPKPRPPELFPTD